MLRASCSASRQDLTGRRGDWPGPYLWPRGAYSQAAKTSFRQKVARAAHYGDGQGPERRTRGCEAIGRGSMVGAREASGGHPAGGVGWSERRPPGRRDHGEREDGTGQLAHRPSCQPPGRRPSGEVGPDNQEAAKASLPRGRYRLSGKERDAELRHQTAILEPLPSSGFIPPGSSRFLV